MMASKWQLKPGSFPPEAAGVLLVRLTGGRRLHLSPAEPYANTLCGRGIGDSVGYTGPDYNLCPDCAKLANLTPADFLVDADTAAWWDANGFPQ